ncbi:MAG: cysteine desulfurase family protein [Actinomycetota bacterium]
MIYLDHAATAPPDPRVAEAMLPHLTGRVGNPSEPHAAGRRARADLEAARAEIGVRLGAERVVLTGGGTEADNLAVLGRAAGAPGRMVVSALEHPAVLRPAEALVARGWELAVAPVLADGTVDLAALAELVRPGDALCCVMGASNITGVLQPVAAVAELCAARGVPLHVDHVQTAAGADASIAGLPGRVTAAVAAHKLGGPRGVGALVGAVDGLAPLAFGGGQEGGLRPGTEDVAGAVGLACALGLRQGPGAVEERARRAALRDALEARLGLPVAGGSAPRLPGHLLLLTGFRGDTAMALLDGRGVCVAAGSACASGEPEPEAALLAMGIDAATARGAVRVTLGPETTPADVDGCAEAWAAVAAELARAREALA